MNLKMYFWPIWEVEDHKKDYLHISKKNENIQYDALVLDDVCNYQFHKPSAS